MSDYLLGTAGAEKKLCNKAMKILPVRKEINRENRLANASLVRDVIAVKRSWKISWRWLAGKNENNEDQGMGRNDLRSLFDGGTVLNLIIPVEGSANEVVVVLFGSQFNEQPVQTSPYWRWHVSFELVEV